MDRIKCVSATIPYQWAALIYSDLNLANGAWCKAQLPAPHQNWQWTNYIKIHIISWVLTGLACYPARVYQPLLISSNSMIFLAYYWLLILLRGQVIWSPLTDIPGGGGTYDLRATKWPHFRLQFSRHFNLLPVAIASSHMSRDFCL